MLKYMDKIFYLTGKQNELELVIDKLKKFGYTYKGTNRMSFVKVDSESRVIDNNSITYGDKRYKHYEFSKHWDDIYKAILKQNYELPLLPNNHWFFSTTTQIGEKHNKGKLPLDTVITKQFPKAIKAISKCSLFGHNKYKSVDKDWLNFKRVEGGSQSYADAGLRHNMNKASKDSESGFPHIYHKAWNALAELELWIEENEKV